MITGKITRIEMDSELNGNEKEKAIIVYDNNSGKYKLDAASKMEKGREEQTLGKEQTAISDAAEGIGLARYSSPTLIELRITDENQVSLYKLERLPSRTVSYGGPWQFTLGRLTKSEAKDVCDIIQQVIDDLV